MVTKVLVTETVEVIMLPHQSLFVFQLIFLNSLKNDFKREILVKFSIQFKGPLTLRDPALLYDGATLVGVVSFGGMCASPDFPNVYGRVTSILDWIAQVIDDKGR